MGKKIPKVPDKIDVNELRLKQRRGWEINPKTRIVESKKLYKRSKAKQKFIKDLRETY
jgi:hypothetical protein